MDRAFLRAVAVASALVLAGAFGVGCLLTNANLELPHAPGGKRCAVPGASVRVVGLYDARPERERIGVKKNGYGEDSASYYLDKAYGGLPDWVESALVEELSSGGFQVAVGDAPQDGLPRISLTLRQFFIEPEMSSFLIVVHGLVLLEVAATMPDGRQFVRLFKGYHKTSSPFLVDSVAQEALLTASRQALGKAAASICELLAREGPF